MPKKSRPSRVLLSMCWSTAWSRMPRSRRSVPTRMRFWTHQPVTDPARPREQRCRSGEHLQQGLPQLRPVVARVAVARQPLHVRQQHRIYRPDPCKPPSGHVTGSRGRRERLAWWARNGSWSDSPHSPPVSGPSRSWWPCGAHAPPGAGAARGGPAAGHRHRDHRHGEVRRALLVSFPTDLTASVPACSPSVTDTALPTEPTGRKLPTEPMDRNESTEPIDRDDRFDQRQRQERRRHANGSSCADPP